MNKVERWGIFEIAVSGPSEGNPFVDHRISGSFHSKNEDKQVIGFYDGEGIYRVRFMPSFEGEYCYKISADFLEQPVCGTFFATAPSAGNHGPVRVHNRYHFAYEDGTPYYSIGTTCYVWDLQSDERIAQTLETLKKSAFNKIRFCIFPKHYVYNFGEPRSYPYVGTPMDSSVLTEQNFWQYNGHSAGNQWDFFRFNPEHFQHIEWCILQLQNLGIEADIIVMHPYDRWGFSCMNREQDTHYWKYVLARFSAYRNVWWSLANEYDFMRDKCIDDWEHYASLICEFDPYRHLRSIHNGSTMYDHSRSWITHCSVQRVDLYKTGEMADQWRTLYGKPVVMDEIAYEGNIPDGWGNITGEELLRRFWESACRGGYPGHGETYCHPQNILWWSHGGQLHGESHKRFHLLHKILSETPGIGLKCVQRSWDCTTAVPQEDGKGLYYLMYYSFMRPSSRDFYFDDTTPIKVTVIDTWEGTRQEYGTFTGSFRVNLPGKQYMAIRLMEDRS